MPTPICNKERNNEVNFNVNLNKVSWKNESHTLTSSPILDLQNSKFAERIKAFLEVFNIDILFPAIIECAWSLLNVSNTLFSLLILLKL